MKDLGLINSLRTFNLDDFHFLRPEWLWLYLCLLILTILIFLSNREKSSWKTMIAEHLRKFMFSEPRKGALIWPLIFFFLAISFGIFSVSGPAWKRVDVPGMKSSAVFMILVDLSWSMMATDLQPNRLERAKLKIRDLMDANPRAQTGLLAYAGTTHPVLPLTSDYKLIKHYSDYLEAGIMPVRGDNLDLAFDVLDTLFQRYEAPSTLLLITDEVEPDETGRLTQFVDNSPHRLEVLVMSTPNGAVVPGFRRNTTLKDEAGKPILSKADINTWNQLDMHPKIKINKLTLDKSDVEQIAARVSKELEFQLQDEQSTEEWQDEGLLFILPTLLFALFFFRKGWMIQWCFFIGATSIVSCSPDNSYADLWYTADYKGQFFAEQGRYMEAAESYEDPLLKAAAYYRAGDFEAAASLYALDSSAQGFFNYGLALANLGEFDEAKRAIELAMEKDSSIQTGKNVLTQINSAITAIDSINRFDPEKALSEKNLGPLKERKATSKDEELSSDTEVDELPTDGDRVTDEVTSDITKAEELERPPENMEMGRQEEAQKILLRRISSKPTEFLRRRFKFQREKYYPEVREEAKKW